MQNRYRIKSRLCDIGKTQRWLAEQLKGYGLNPGHLSDYINGTRDSETGDKLLKAADLILKKYERN